MTRTVSTWSLHRTLGRFIAPDSSALGGPLMDSPAETTGLALIDLPRELERHGYDTLQICHFHLPSRSPEYLDRLRAALEGSGITVECLLIDDGDLTDVANADRIEAWLGEWLDVAVSLGATRARLIMGRSAPTPDLVRESAGRIRRLAAAHPDVRIVIENWLGMFPDGQAVRDMLAETGDTAGLLIDLGNWRGADKYDQLAVIAPLAETCHAKCHSDATGLNAEDYQRSLTILKDAGYTGPLSLIYDGPDDDEWAQLDEEYGLTQQVFA